MEQSGNETNPCMNYGQAIQAVDQGEIISRLGWNGKGRFVFKQVPCEIGKDIIPKMQSVPQKAKDHILALGVTLKYRNQMAICDSDGNVDSWVASSSDTFATDYFVVPAGHKE